MTVTRERLRLANHAGVSGTTVQGWRAFFFGLPFVAAWLIIRLGMTGVIEGVKPSSGIPPLLVNSCAWMFGMAGFYLCVLGIEGVLRGRRHRAVSATHPDTPWLADHDWNRSAVSDDTWRHVRRAFFGMAIFTSILGPLGYLAFFHTERFLLFQIVSSVFGLVWIFATWHTAALCLRALRFGSGRAHFREFPYFLGERMRATIELPTDVRALDRLEITLRSVSEEYEVSGTDDNRTERVVCYQTFGETRVFETPEDLQPTGGGRHLEVDFDLPPDGEPTALQSRPARFWELELKGERRGLNLHSVFMLPVYAKVSPRGSASRALTPEPGAPAPASPPESGTQSPQEAEA